MDNQYVDVKIKGQKKWLRGHISDSEDPIAGKKFMWLEPDGESKVFGQEVSTKEGDGKSIDWVAIIINPDSIEQIRVIQKEKTK